MYNFLSSFVLFIGLVFCSINTLGLSSQHSRAVQDASLSHIVSDIAERHKDYLIFNFQIDKVCCLVVSLLGKYNSKFEILKCGQCVLDTQNGQN